MTTRVASDPTKPAGAPGSLVVVDERPKPPTKAELYRALMHYATSSRSGTPSVELSRNAKHEVQYKVTVYDEDAEEAMAKAVKIENALALLYPAPGPEKP